jgi:hypothetical protein
VDSIGKLRQEKKELLEKISTAAREGKSEAVLSASEKLRKIEMLINRYEQLEVEIAELQKEGGFHMNTGAAIESQMKPTSTAIPRISVKTVREHGREIRETFLKRLLQTDISLQSVKGETIYRCKSGEKVGIAVATERQPNRWFLGLPAGGFDHAVLLCQRESGDVVEIRLPKEFFAKYGSNLSESKGQVKFNISCKGSVFVVKVPGTDGVNPATFSSDYSFLR